MSLKLYYHEWYLTANSQIYLSPYKLLEYFNLIEHISSNKCFEIDNRFCDTYYFKSIQLFQTAMIFVDHQDSKKKRPDLHQVFKFYIRKYSLFLFSIFKCFLSCFFFIDGVRHNWRCNK